MKKTLSYIYLALACFATIFIFYNSMQDCVASSEMSGGILDFFCSLLKITSERAIYIANFIIRKIAHMVEFAFLGFFWGMFFLSRGENKFHHLIYVLFIGLLTACTDEFIQLFPEGRSARVQDIWVDFSGTGIGLLASVIFNKIIQKMRGK